MNKKILRNKILVVFDKFLTLIIGMSALVILWLIGQIFFWASLKVPSLSMKPEILAGDRVVVWKPWMGARLFNIFGSMGGKQPLTFPCTSNNIT